MLPAAAEEYDAQQYLAALAVAESAKAATRGPRVLAQLIQTYQAAAIALAIEFLPSLLATQGIADEPQGLLNPGSLLTDLPSLERMAVAADAEFERLVQSLVTDAERAARAVDIAVRPGISYVRSLNPPACSRCVVLAGRVYRWSDGFLRHPQCDCLMTPVNEATSDLVTDPMEAFENGWIKDLSNADAEAVRLGADLGQVVNVRRKAAGLTDGGTVMRRAGRLTPAGCLELASDQAQAIDLLRANGYIT